MKKYIYIGLGGFLGAMLMVIFKGAYTTFSTFMYEGFSLFQNHKRLNALIYICLTVILGLIFYAIGTYVTKLF